MPNFAKRVRNPVPSAVTATALLLVATSGCAATPAGNAQLPALPPPVSAALADAASHTGVPADRLEVVSVEPVTWRDSSLGCPEPELMYTQALVAGFRITLKAAGKLLDYHADQRGRVLLCPPERAVAPVSPPSAR